MRILSIIIFFIFSLFNLQSNELSNDWNYFKKDIKQVLHGIEKTQVKDFVVPSFVLIGIVASSQYDEEFRTFSKFLKHTESNNNFNTYQIFVNQIGEPTVFLVFPGVIYSVGYLFNSSAWRRTGKLTYESVIINGIATGLLKFSLGRARPYMELGNTHFEPFNTNDDYMSFPSGHTSMAFAMATILAHRSKNTFASIGYYLIASSTGMARIYFDKHWLSDVLSGAAIGTISALAVISAEKKVRQYETDNTFVPIVRIGISF